MTELQKYAQEQAALLFQSRSSEPQAHAIKSLGGAILLAALVLSEKAEEKK